MKNQATFRERLPSLMEHLYLKFVLSWRIILQRKLVREARHFASTLEVSAFAEPQKIRQTKVTILAKEGGSLFLPEEGDMTCQKISQTEALAAFLSDVGIHKIELDTLLEASQITDALKLLFYCGRNLKKDLPFTPGPKTYNASSLAALLASESGLNKFCANIRFDKNSGVLAIQYSYCELFYTFMVNTVLDRYTKTKNHQAIFALAPRIGGLIGLLFFLHHIFWSPYSAVGITAALLGSLALGSGVSYLTNTIASILYDQKHRDKLLGENTKEISALSHLLNHNPNPILKISHEGSILFANSAAESQAQTMGFSRKRISEILPENYLGLIGECLNKQKELFDLEVSKHGRTLRFNISPFPNERAVLAAGTDITKLKELEVELRQLNENLEKKVIARTKELASAQDITILSLSSLAETRAPETVAHIQRTRLYVKILAGYLRTKPPYQKDLPDEQCLDLLYRSAPLYDIGKVGIPDSILLKQGKLTDEEFEIMKKHPVIGGDSLRWAAEKLGKNSFLQLAREIAYGHHEKWDGSGYPSGLAAGQIPLSCRLMALADVYDALVNKRVYKEAYSHEKAKDVILTRKGSHFDPDIVDAFLALEEEFITIAKKYKDHE